MLLKDPGSGLHQERSPDASGSTQVLAPLLSVLPLSAAINTARSLGKQSQGPEERARGVGRLNEMRYANTGRLRGVAPHWNLEPPLLSNGIQFPRDRNA